MGAVAGADGCRAGWLAVERGVDGSVAATVYRSTPELMERARSLEFLTLDIPIALPDNGPRPVDLSPLNC
jgi:predicted RNase H-like nuclease